MSFRVVFICEDHTLDQYIIRPVLVALLSHLGKPRAQIRAVTDPRLTGLAHLRRELPGVLRRYAQLADLMVVAIDQDCDAQRRDAFERLLGSCEGREKTVLVTAEQELEVWAMWGERGQLGEQWSEVRRECHPKERFLPSLLAPADLRQPGRGRSRLAASSLQRGWTSLAAGCPELGELESRLRDRFRQS